MANILHLSLDQSSRERGERRDAMPVALNAKEKAKTKTTERKNHFHNQREMAPPRAVRNFPYPMSSHLLPGVKCRKEGGGGNRPGSPFFWEEGAGLPGLGKDLFLQHLKTAQNGQMAK